MGLIGFIVKAVVASTVLETAAETAASACDYMDKKTTSNKLDNLHKLRRLYESGTISEREYKKKKRQLLRD